MTHLITGIPLGPEDWVCISSLISSQLDLLFNKGICFLDRLSKGITVWPQSRIKLSLYLNQVCLSIHQRHIFVVNSDILFIHLFIYLYNLSTNMYFLPIMYQTVSQTQDTPWSQVWPLAYLSLQVWDKIWMLLEKDNKQGKKQWGPSGLGAKKQQPEGTGSGKASWRKLSWDPQDDYELVKQRDEGAKSRCKYLEKTGT